MMVTVWKYYFENAQQFFYSKGIIRFNFIFIIYLYI